MSISFIHFDLGGVLVGHFASFKVIATKAKISEDKLTSLFYDNADAIDQGLMLPKEFEDVFYRTFKSSGYKFNKSFSEKRGCLRQVPSR